MSLTTFRFVYDRLPRQIPLALSGCSAVSVGQHSHPAFRHAAFGPVTYVAGAQSEGTSEIGEPSLMGDGFFENGVHTHDFNTIVSAERTHLHCHTVGMNTVAKRLKHARSEKGWNQAQMAVAAEVSPGTIGNIESGARQAKGSLPQIAKALGVSHDWLANGVGEMWAAPPSSVSDGQAPREGGPSSQAALLALLFDKLDDDVVLRAKVFNKATSIIIETIQGTHDTEAVQTPAPKTQEPVKKQFS